jgi:hypothetical protein
MKSQVGTSQVSAAVFLSALVGGAHALKPPYQEIYQTTTVATANENAILAADYICPDGWFLLLAASPLCDGKLPDGFTIFSGSVSCMNYGAEVFIPSNMDEQSYMASLAGDSKIYIGVFHDGSMWTIDNSPGNPPSYTYWDEGGEPASGGFDCVYIDSSDGYWQVQPCSTTTSSTVICRKAATEFTDGGSVGVSQPPASVNGAAGGLLTVPVNGELILYNQYIDQSTGAESAYQFPKLTFVEADEEIYRAALVNSLFSITSFLNLPSSPLLFSPLSRITKEALSPVSLPRPTPPLLKAKCTISPENSVLGLLNKS